MEAWKKKILYGDIKPFLAITCLHCGRECPAERRTKKYCNKKCRNAASRERNEPPKQPPKRYPRECGYCRCKYKAKKFLDPDKPGYCKASHRSAAHRQRRKYGELTLSSYGTIALDGPPNEESNDVESNLPCVLCSNIECRTWLVREEIDKQGYWRATCGDCGTANIAPPPGVVLPESGPIDLSLPCPAPTLPGLSPSPIARTATGFRAGARGIW